MPLHTPICPKCGYDQSGEITTWKTKCPLQGTCPECGLTFNWTEIFNSHLTHIPWYIEHATSWTNLIARTPSTLLHLVFPNIFWKRLLITADIKIKTLLIWYISLALAVHLLVSFSNATMYYLEISSQIGWQWTNFKSKGFYAYPELAFNSIFQSILELGSGRGPFSFDAIQLHWSGYRQASDTLMRPISFSLGINLMWLFVLLIIPTTRRLAKVRTAHILRAFILSMLCTLLIVQLSRLGQHGLRFYWRPRNQLLGFRPALQLLILWQLFFWPVAICIGWKIKPAKLLIILGTIAAFLLGLLLNITLFILPDLIS